MNRIIFSATVVILTVLTPHLATAKLPVAGEDIRTNKPSILVPAPVGTTATASDKTGKSEDILRFRNTDILRGNLLALSQADGLRWAHAQSKSPLAFELGGLQEIQFGATAQVRSGGVARVRLTNGDVLAGELLALTEDALKVQTWYAGPVTIKRAMLASLEPNTSLAAQIFTGPNNLAEWQRPNRGNIGWTFRKGALISPPGGGGQNIGRDVKIPDLATIECDLAWQGYPSLYLLFYVDNIDNYYQGECYGLQISGSSIYLQRASRNSGMNNVEAAINFEGLQRRTKARVMLKVNKPKRTFALFIDGKFIKQWTDDNPFEGRGTGLGFAPQGNPLRISNITVSDWDGRLDLDDAPGKAADEDFIRLANGDKLSGRLGNIANGQAALTTSYATMQVPLERIAEITMAAKNQGKPRRQPGDVFAMFPDGSRITLALDKLDAQQLTGASESFGKITAQSSVFQKIQFNIYEPKPEDEEDDWATPATAPGGRRGIRGGAALMVE